MRKRMLLIGLIVCIVTIGSRSGFGLEQQPKGEYTPNTGDVELDVTLGNLNIEAEANLIDFVGHLSVTYNVPQETIEPLIAEEEMPPADVYLALVLSNLTEQPLEKVIEVYKANQGKGWGVIAEQLGIKPGSEEFHKLKQGSLTELEQAKNAKQAKEKNTKASDKGTGKKPDKEEKPGEKK